MPTLNKNATIITVALAVSVLAAVFFTTKMAPTAGTAASQQVIIDR